MTTRILAAYASTHGSTAEIASAVATTLQARGLAVDKQLARNTSTLEAYDAIVLGAPIYVMHLHKDALRFISRHRKALSGEKPLFIFAGGPFDSEHVKVTPDAEVWLEVRMQLDRDLAKFPWLKPAAVAVFGGKFDPQYLRFPWNLIPALQRLPPSDLRDWEKIHNWADGLAGQLLAIR